MFYGFTEFCQYFLERFPGGYYLWPLRLNGSALEQSSVSWSLIWMGSCQVWTILQLWQPWSWNAGFMGGGESFSTGRPHCIWEQCHLKGNHEWTEPLLCCMTVKNCGYLQVFSLLFFKLWPLINYYKLDKWPQWKQWVWFSQDPNMKQTGTLRIEENIISLFPMGPVIKCCVIPPKLEMEKSEKKKLIWLMPAGQHTNLLWFKGPCLDHVQVQDSCCFAREWVLTQDTWRFPTKFLGNLFELGGVKINFSKLANFNYNIIDDISKA